MEQNIEHLIALGRSVWRYRWPALGTAWGIVLIGWLAVHFISVPYYTASSQIYIDTETVLQPLLKGLAAEVHQSEQVGLMARQLMSRPNLEQVVQQTGLSHQGTKAVPLGVVLERLRADISLKAERTSTEARFTNFFVITYTNTDPELAKQVVQSLMTAFSENTLAEIRQDAERARAFIEQQIAVYQEQLVAAETRLREFKSENVDVLPHSGRGYFQRLQVEQGALEEVELEILQMKSLLEVLDVQLGEISITTRALGDDGTPALTPLQSRLRALQTELDELLLKYTEAHPKVIETRASIAELDRQRRESNERVPTIPNPEYQQLELRRKETEGKLAGLRTKQEAYRIRVEDLEKQIGTLTLVENELQQLTREYETNMQNYQDMVARRQSMSMSESVEQNNEDMRFRVIEPPNVPLDAILAAAWKKALMLMSAVLVAGLAGGLALAYGLSQIRPAIYSQSDLTKLTGLPVYGLVSHVFTFRSRMRRRLDIVAFGSLSLMIVVAYGVALVLQYSATYGVEIPWVQVLQKPMVGHG